MVIVKLMGGMGNQMFQYAFGFFLAKKNRKTLKLDLSFLQDRREKKKIVFREFDLTIFNVSEEVIATKEEIAYYSGVSPNGKSLNLIITLKRKLSLPHHLIDYSLKYHPEYKLITSNIYLEGYFQSPAYFSEIEEDIRKEFIFKNKILPISNELAEKIKMSNSVCLHVRRTDFVEEDLGKNIHGFVEEMYYFNAVKFIKEKVHKPELFIFSDDIEWCQNNLVFDLPTRFVLNEHNGEKISNYLQLMTLCKHFIIPNSTFAWWAAWLSESPDKLVVAPLKWMINSEKDETDLIPKSWIRL